MLNNRKLITLCWLLTLTEASLLAEPLKVFGLGNSFTRNSTRFLHDIDKSDEVDDLVYGVAYIGGSALDLHMDNYRKETDGQPETKARRYSFTIDGKIVIEKASLIQMLEYEKWDVVTIQQVSGKSYKKETFYPHARDLYEVIAKHAPQASVVVHETWSHRLDCPRTKEWELHPDVMYEKLHDNYMEIARELNAKLIPVGTAIQRARYQPRWHFILPKGFARDMLVHPELPNQAKSLHVGYQWKRKNDGSHYVSMDGYHLNRNGEYLGGLVWYAFFTGKDPRQVRYTPKHINEEGAMILKESAWVSMKDYPTYLD
jgi:hypothetical protein